MSQKDTASMPKNDEKVTLLWGWPINRWATLIVCVALGSFFLFVAAPFLLSLLIPIFAEKPNDYVYLVDTLDGVALVLGLVGTIASVISIFMTLADQKRFSNEKEQTATLVKSVEGLHDEIGVVEDYVRKTFEDNRELSLQLYNANIIPRKPDKVDFGVSTAVNGCNWENVQKAREIPLVESQQNQSPDKEREEEGK